MKDSILMAIESLCDDIARDTSADNNHNRAKAILGLALSGLLLPEEDILNSEE